MNRYDNSSVHSMAQPPIKDTTAAVSIESPPTVVPIVTAAADSFEIWLPVSFPPWVASIVYTALLHDETATQTKSALPSIATPETPIAKTVLFSDTEDVRVCERVRISTVTTLRLATTATVVRARTDLEQGRIGPPQKASTQVIVSHNAKWYRTQSKPHQDAWRVCRQRCSLLGLAVLIACCADEPELCRSLPNAK